MGSFALGAGDTGRHGLHHAAPCYSASFLFPSPNSTSLLSNGPMQGTVKERTRELSLSLGFSRSYPSLPQVENAGAHLWFNQIEGRRVLLGPRPAIFSRERDLLVQITPL